MYSLPQFLKELRKQENLSQFDLAQIIGVSTILISMIEAGQKTASRKFIELLSNKLQVNPGTLALFSYDLKQESSKDLTVLEKNLLDIGTKFQKQLITKKAKNLKIDAKE